MFAVCDARVGQRCEIESKLWTSKFNSVWDGWETVAGKIGYYAITEC
jgi:hypothetical protein